MNIAPPEILGGAVLPLLLDAVDRAGLPPGTLVLEVTEDSLLADPQRAREILGGLHGHGVEISVDDYGTGFSSLSYLRDLQTQELKIDRSFVSGLRTEESSRMIVRSTISMAHALGIRVVAEGVEDAQTATDLVAMGVDTLQGYHVARPMPVEALEAWIRDRSKSSWASWGPVEDAG